MATVSILNQGLSAEYHVDEIQRISGINNITSLTLCSAFANLAGVNLILSSIPNNIPNVRFYLGAKNGITSAQAIAKAFSAGHETYIVDTGGVLFHPKIYLSENATTGFSIIGSANLTLSGLTQNIEISTITEYDLNDVNDLTTYDQIKNLITDLPNVHPNNVHRITSLRQIIDFKKNGVLVDERVKQASTNKGTSKSGSQSTSPRMRTHRKVVRGIISLPKTKTQITRIKKLVPAGVNQWILVWESTGLARRDLNIPNAAGTNPTGSMGFSRGRTVGIDQRHYFRDVVFDGLNWQFDTNPRTAHYERTSADFEIEIQGVNHGVFNLRLKHNTSTTSGAYIQNNSMTSIHWDQAKALVADSNLLGEKLTLYRSTSRDDLFRIEIG